MRNLSFYENVRVISKAIDDQQVDSDVLKLLKKKEYYQYFFEIVKSPIWFDALKEEGFFDPSKAPGPEKVKDGYRIPLWPILPYLVEVARSTRSKKNRKYVADLKKIIHDVTSNTSGNPAENYITAKYFISILAELPNDSVTVSEINLIPLWFMTGFDTSIVTAEIMNKLLPNFLTEEAAKTDIQKAELLILYVLQPVPAALKGVNPLREGRKRTLADSYWIIEGLIKNKSASKLGKLCDETFIYKLADVLENILKERYPVNENGFYDYSHIWFNLLSNGQDLKSDSVEETVATILHSILITKAETDYKQTKKILKAFLNKKYPIYTRFVLSIINTYWDDYREVINDVFVTKKQALFNDGDFDKDLSNLFINHITDFTIEQKTIISKFIADGPTFKPEKETEKYIAYWKQGWYKSMLKDKIFASLYEECKKLTNTEIPDSRNADNLSWVDKHDTISKLQKEIEENPQIIFTKRSEYLLLSAEPVSAIFFGLREAWNNGKDIPWEEAFNFVKEYLIKKSSGSSESNSENDPENKYTYVISAAAQLIEAGLKEDKHMSNNLIEMAQSILFIFLQLLNGYSEEEVSEKHGYLFHALNAAYGTTITSMFYIAYLYKNSDKKNNSTNFDTNWPLIKDGFDKLFQKEVLDMYVLFGRYLPWFYHIIDKKWSKSVIKEIIPDKNKNEWVAFMEGYLFNSQVNNEIYGLLKNHYRMAFTYEFHDKELNRRLLQNICLGYLWDFKESKKEIGRILFEELVEKSNSRQKESIIDFFAQQHDAQSKTKTIIWPRIRDFWKSMYLSYKEKKLTVEDKKVVSGLSRFMAFLPMVDKTTYKWLSFSVPYAYIGYEEPFVLEYLDVLKDVGETKEQKKKSAIFIGELYLSLLRDVEFAPIYDQKHIDSIINYLYKFGDASVKKLADDISNLYGIKGSYILKDVWEKNN